jgi:ABC-2 type transport system permease protein
MMADLWTVIWKEWKEILFLRFSLRRGALGLLLFLGVFGIFLPLQTGRAWVESPIVLFYWLWVPLFLVSGMVADSFAGERERHTLEALLATRLPDRAILLGKICAAIAYGWGMTLACLLVGLVTVNLAYGRGELLLYPAKIGGGILGVSLLTAGLVANAGVLLSLRASSVQQAQQTLSIAVMLLLFVPLFGSQALPSAWKKRLIEALAQIEVTNIMLLAAAVLIALNIGLLATASARFKRARLMLD